MDQREKSGIRFSVLFTGTWRKNAVFVSQKNHPSDWPPDFQAQADNFWAEKTAANPLLYNGGISTLSDFRAKGECVNLTFGDACYKNFLFINDLILKGETPAFARHEPPVVGVSAAVVTRDNRLPLIWRSQTVGEYPEMWDVMGGHIEPRKHSDSAGTPDPFLAIEDEVCEEIGVRSEDILSTVCIGLIKNAETAKPELLFSVQLDATQSEVRERMKNAGESHEYTTETWLPATAGALSGFLESEGEKCTPSAEGCLAVFRDFLANQCDIFDISAADKLAAIWL